MRRYYVGQGITLPALFEVDGEPVDPAEVEFWVRHTGAAEATVYRNGVDAEVVHPSVGDYRALLVAAEPYGVYYWGVVGGAGAQAAMERAFEVIETRRTP